MCLAAFAINASSRWPLVLASNRDEFFDRPALALASWQTVAGHTITSGRDVLAGGTWLGMSPGGRVALLTNVREAAPQASPRSRGELVVRWLEGSGPVQTAQTAQIAKAAEAAQTADLFTRHIDGSLYGGFNLVLGDLQTGQWHWCSNRPTAGANLHLQLLGDGVYGLSNAALDTPWPKTMAIKTAMVQALKASSLPGLEAALFKALSNQNRAAPEQLPKTGVPPELELALSSAHVSLPERNYGTRCASVLVVQATAANFHAPERHFTMRLTEKTYLVPDLNLDLNPDLNPDLISDSNAAQAGQSFIGAGAGAGAGPGPVHTPVAANTVVCSFTVLAASDGQRNLHPGNSQADQLHPGQ